MLLQVGLHPQNAPHELLTGHFPSIPRVSHPKHISQGQTHLPQLVTETVDCFEERVDVGFVLGWFLEDRFLSLLLGLLVAECFVELLLFLEVVLEQFDIVAILLNCLGCLASHRLHI